MRGNCSVLSFIALIISITIRKRPILFTTDLSVLGLDDGGVCVDLRALIWTLLQVAGLTTHIVLRYTY